MKFLKNKSIFQKIIFIILLIAIFGFTFCGTVRAVTAAQGIGEVFGSLIKPIVNFLKGVGDVFMDFAHQVVVSQNKAGIWAAQDTQGWVSLVCFVVGLAVAVLAMVLIGIGFAFAGALIGKAIAAIGITGVITSASVPVGLVVILGARCW